MSTLIAINSSLGLFYCFDCGEQEVDLMHYCDTEDDQEDADS